MLGCWPLGRAAVPSVTVLPVASPAAASSPNRPRTCGVMASAAPPATTAAVPPRATSARRRPTLRPGSSSSSRVGSPRAGAARRGPGGRGPPGRPSCGPRRAGAGAAVRVAVGVLLDAGRPARRSRPVRGGASRRRTARACRGRGTRPRWGAGVRPNRGRPGGRRGGTFWSAMYQSRFLRAPAACDRGRWRQGRRLLPEELLRQSNQGPRGLQGGRNAPARALKTVLSPPPGGRPRQPLRRDLPSRADARQPPRT